ncbi:PRC-barrel domain-containing protein [Novosphingobium sp.]|uniref:PRC-barrel domain-containing protein n=1 Tax=Novosphingobium sp. TaxID=1874826 RepID=UPI003B517FE7
MALDTYPATPDGLETRETGDTISSRKVEGTAVYDRAEQHLGTIESFMVNKLSGQVEYVVLQFGGLFGIGSDYFPVPWNQLRYSRNLGGYIVDLDRTVLDKAPRYAQTEEPAFDGPYGREVSDYYGTFMPI